MGRATVVYPTPGRFSEPLVAGEGDIALNLVRNSHRKGINMRTRVDRSPHLLSWIAVTTAVLCAAGIAAFIAWMPTATGSPKDLASLTELSPTPTRPAGAQGDKAPAGVMGDAPTSTTCAECGVVELVPEIATRDEQAADSTRSYAFTIRFRDGSRRVFLEATPRMWRAGTQVRVID